MSEHVVNLRVIKAPDAYEQLSDAAYTLHHELGMSIIDGVEACWDNDWNPVLRREMDRIFEALFLLGADNPPREHCSSCSGEAWEEWEDRKYE